MPPKALGLEPVVRTARAKAVTALACSPWAPLVAVGGQKQVLLYNSDTLDLIGVLPFPEGEPHVLKFSRNGSLLLAGGGHAGKSGKVVVWSVKTGERIIEVGDETDAVLAADISPDQTQIALGGPSKVVRIYSTKDGKLLHEIRKHTDWITALEYSPDGVLLATGDRNGGLFVWEAFTAREYFTLRGHTAAITEISWRSDGNVVRLGQRGRDGSAVGDGERQRDQDVGRPRRRRRVGALRPRRPASPRRAATSWRSCGTATAIPCAAFDALPDVALRTAFTRDDARVIAGDWTGQVMVWTAADGKAVGQLSPNPPTLAERLDAAQKDVAAKQAARDQTAAAATASQAASQQAAAALAAAQKAAADAAANAKTTADAAAAAKAASDKANAAVAAVQADLRAKDGAGAGTGRGVGEGEGRRRQGAGRRGPGGGRGQGPRLAGAAATEQAQAQKNATDPTAAATNATNALAAAQQAATNAANVAAAAPGPGDGGDGGREDGEPTRRRRIRRRRPRRRRRSRNRPRRRRNGKRRWRPRRRLRRASEEASRGFIPPVWFPRWRLPPESRLDVKPADMLLAPPGVGRLFGPSDVHGFAGVIGPHGSDGAGSSSITAPACRRGDRNGARRLRPITARALTAWEKVVPERPRRHVDAVPGRDLVIGRGVAELDDLAPADRQHHAARVGRRRPVQDDVVVRRPGRSGRPPPGPRPAPSRGR